MLTSTISAIEITADRISKAPAVRLHFRTSAVTYSPKLQVEVNDNSHRKQNTSQMKSAHLRTPHDTTDLIMSSLQGPLQADSQAPTRTSPGVEPGACSSL